MNYSELYKKVVQVIAQSDSFEASGLKLSLYLCLDASGKELNDLFIRMVNKGWLQQELIESNEQTDPNFDFAWNKKKEEYVYSLTPLGQKEFKETIDLSENGYLLSYSLSTQRIVSIETGLEVLRINKNSPIYIALTASTEGDSRFVLIKDIVLVHKKHDIKTNEKIVMKSFENFRPKFLKKLEDLNIQLAEKETELWSAKGEYVVLPACLKIEK